MIETGLSTRSVHETTAMRVFGDHRYGGPQVFDFPLRTFLFSNRSGSNLLADLLESTGEFALFEEVMDEGRLPTATSRSLPEYMTQLISDAGDRRFGVKLHHSQMMLLHRTGILKMFAGVQVIHTVREDLVAQAVSFCIAEQTGWWSSELTSVVPQKSEPRFDFDRIRSVLDFLAFERGLSAAMLSLYQLPAMELVYEEIVGDPDGCTRRAAAFFGVNVGSGWRPSPRLQKQATETNQRYCSEFRDKFITLIER